ncbi:integrase, catalytic region, zinc finger, CCHC-type containing protein [Tanacetum coccineum]
MYNPTRKHSDASLVKIEAPKKLPKVSLVNESLKKLKFHLARFDNVVKIRTTPDARTEGEWGFEHTKSVFNNEIIPFLKYLKDIFNVFDRDLLNEIMEVKTVFDQMDAAVQQSLVDKQCLEIAKKELFLENDRLLQQIMSQDVLLTVMNSMSLRCESVNMDGKKKESCNLEAELLKSQNAFNDLLKRYSQLKRHCMFKLDLEPLAPRLLQNREIHIQYLKYTQEQANILQGIVEQAKEKKPLDKKLYFACKHAQRIQELLVYVQDMCPNAIKLSAKKVAVTPKYNVKKVRFAEPLTSPSNIKQKSMFDGVHDKCLLGFVENMNSRAKSAKKHTKQHIWKPTGHVFTDVGLKWKPTGRTFTIVGLSKKAKIVESKNANHSKPNHTWGSNATDIPSSSSLVMTVRFGNDHIARMIGYGDYQLGNVTISRVYYVDGLGHNLFYVGQFCDGDLEVAFQKNTCFIRNLEGVDLLSGSRDTNLYTISLDDMFQTSLICLLSKASKTKSWLWHRHLSYLNFGTLNKLAKDGLARGIPRLKFQKDHLYSACALGKSKISSHQPKDEETNQEKLYLLYMDLCGPMRVASINGKRYILVIIEDYSRFTWVRFLRTKDEAPEAIIKCIKNIQVCLNATVRNIRTDNGTEFVNQTLLEFYENVGISH